MPLKNSPLAVLGFLYHLVGPRAVLLPIAFGRELPNWPNWQKTTLRESTESAFQHRLLRAIEAGGNISALLGPTGGNVCVIEITFAEQLEIFLSLNPWTRETFWTKDAHGCQIWTRITGDYHPTRINSKTQNKRHPIAKWRGGGGDQCLLYGEDPNGRRIQRIGATVSKASHVFEYSLAARLANIIRRRIGRRAACRLTRASLSQYVPAVNPAVWRAMEVSLPHLQPAQVLVFPQSSHGAARVL